MPIRIKFDKEKLQETVRLFRIVAGINGPDIETATVTENLAEVLNLAESLQRSGETGDLFNLDSRVVTANDTGEPETWVFLQPTEAIILRASALHGAVWAIDRDRALAG